MFWEILKQVIKGDAAISCSNHKEYNTQTLSVTLNNKRKQNIPIFNM